MKLNSMLSIYAMSLASVMTIASCKEEIKLVFINPPFEELEPEFVKFSIDIARGDTLTIKSGTTIIIPPYALTDSIDRLATGEATILYRELRNEIDILLSGIPMDMEIGGELRQMQTAGMFELRAMQGVLELGLATDKKISVRFATDEQDTDYNFFALNDSSGKWEFRDYSEIEPNPKRRQIVKKIETLQPSFKIPFSENYFVFNNMEVEGSKNTRISRYGLENYNLFAGHVTFKGSVYNVYSMVWESVSGHKFPAWTANQRCEVNKIQGHIYQLKVSDKKLGKSFALNARLVMPLEYVLQFSPAKWKEDYESSMALIEIEEERLAADEGLFRSMSVSGFGIYNFDKLMKHDSAIKIKPKFEVNGMGEEYQIKYVYGIPGDGKSVIRINVNEAEDLYLDPTDGNFRFLTVLPDDKVGLFAAWQYTNIDFESLATQKNPSYTFKLNVQPQQIKSETDLNRVLALARN